MEILRYEEAEYRAGVRHGPARVSGGHEATRLL